MTPHHFMDVTRRTASRLFSPVGASAGRVSFAPRLLVALLTVALVATACGRDSTADDDLAFPLKQTATAVATTVVVSGDTATAVPAATVAEVATIAPVNTPIPTTAPPTPVPESRTTDTEYTIVSGDTLGEIAEQFDISLSTLLAANPNVNPNAMSVGDTLTIPPNNAAAGPTPTKTATAIPTPAATAVPVEVGERTPGKIDSHTVRNGQFLSVIASAYGVSVDAIVALNGLASANSIIVGQELQIPPVGSSGGGATATPTVAGGTATPTPTVDPNATATPTPTVDPNATATPTVDANATATPTADPNATPTATVSPTPTTDANQTTPTLTPTPTTASSGGATPTPTLTACQMFQTC